MVQYFATDFVAPSWRVMARSSPTSTEAVDISVDYVGQDRRRADSSCLEDRLVTNSPQRTKAIYIKDI
jgi:hypothetical protein